MRLAISTVDDRVFPVEVEVTDPIENIKLICEAETGMPSVQQVLLLNGQPLDGRASVSACGLSDGDLLMLVPAALMQQQAQSRGGGAAAGGAGRGGGGRAPPAALQQAADGSMLDPVLAIAQLKSDRVLLTNLRASNPRLAAAVEAEDIIAFQEELRQAYKAKAAVDAEVEDLYRRAEADPFDVEVQRRLEELIQQKNVDDNYAHALENNPEFFVSVPMLYVEMETNGVHVKAFIDSGAQMTIMTEQFAAKCHLMHMLDKRFQGVARGVGESKIVGRIHTAKIKVGSQVMITSITVLEQKSGPQFIFGLDMLKRHRCCIDLGKHVLHIGSLGVDLPFLQESQIPTDFSDMIEEGVSEAEAARRMDSVADTVPPPAANTVPQPAPSAPAPSAPAPAPAPQAIPLATQTGQLQSTPPAAAPAVTSAPGGGGGDLESKVSVLMGLGMSREAAVTALQQTGGNVDLAASLMFD